MSISKAQLIASVRKATGVTEGDPDLTNTEIELYLNRSLWFILDKFPFREKERAGAFETIVGTRNYEVPSPVEAMRGFAVVDIVSKQTTELQLMDIRETENLYSESTEAYGKPEKYLLENCYVRLWPTPDKIYKIQFHKYTVLDDIQSSGIPIAEVWNDMILYGANERAFIDFGDIGRATYFHNMVASLLNSMTPQPQKEIIDTSYAGVFVPGGRYDNQC